MLTLRPLLARFGSSRTGATAIEYGLIAALIATAIIGALTATGSSVSGLWDYVSGVVVPALQSRAGE